jgi:hypothetical protein
VAENTKPADVVWHAVNDVSTGVAYIEHLSELLQEHVDSMPRVHVDALARAIQLLGAEVQAKLQTLSLASNDWKN